MSPEEYSAWRKSVDRGFEKSFRVAGVQIAGLQRVNPEYVRAQIKSTVPGAEVSPAQIAADTSRIFALGDFEKVEYEIVDKPAYPTVEFTAIEKSWGPDFLRFDLGLAASGGGDFYVRLAGGARAHLGQFARRHLAQHTSDRPDRAGRDGLLPAARSPPSNFSSSPSPTSAAPGKTCTTMANGWPSTSSSEGYGELDVGDEPWHPRPAARGHPPVRGAGEPADGRLRSCRTLDWTRESDLVFKAIYDTRDSVALPTRGAMLLGRYITPDPGWAASSPTRRRCACREGLPVPGRHAVPAGRPAATR